MFLRIIIKSEHYNIQLVVLIYDLQGQMLYVMYIIELIKQIKKANLNVVSYNCPGF